MKDIMTRTQVVGAIAFTALAVALIIGSNITDPTGKSTPMVTTVIGFVGLAVAQILNHVKTDKTDKTVDKLDSDLRNGTFRELIRQAVEDIAKDTSSTLEITKEGRERNG